MYIRNIWNSNLPCFAWVCLQKGISPKTATELDKIMIIHLI